MTTVYEFRLFVGTKFTEIDKSHLPEFIAKSQDIQKILETELNVAEIAPGIKDSISGKTDLTAKAEKAYTDLKKFLNSL